MKNYASFTKLTSRFYMNIPGKNFEINL